MLFKALSSTAPCPVEEAPAVRVSPLSRSGRGAGGEGNLPSPALGEAPAVRVSPLSRSGRGAGGEGYLPSPALGEAPGVRVAPNSNHPLTRKEGNNAKSNSKYPSA